MEDGVKIFSSRLDSYLHAYLYWNSHLFADASFYETDATDLVLAKIS